MFLRISEKFRMEGQLNLINPENLIQDIFTCIVKSRGIHKKVETKFIITIETLDKIQNGFNQRTPKECWEKNYKHWIFTELLKNPKHGLNQRNPEKIQTKFHMH